MVAPARLSSRAPVFWQQRREIVLVAHARQAREHLAQIGEGVFAVARARLEARERSGRNA
ncbi:MAG TPA: hypothetical protein VGA56_23655 [Opitutaceae bacterium]